jgi:hypothetical protein
MFLASEKTKISLFFRYFGIFTCVFCIMIRINGCFSIFTMYLLFFKWKNVGACSSCSSEWAALTPLKRRVWCFPVVKSGHSLSNWMHGRVLFHMMWRVQINNCWIVADDRLFMFFSFLTTKMYSYPLCLLFLKSGVFVKLRLLRSSIVVAKPTHPQSYKINPLD